MSRKKKVEGKCHICGTVGPLSFEHLPPQKAFNNALGYMTRGREALQRGLIDALPEHPGRSYQGGYGEYTLCEQCNNNTGSWYGPAYVDWAMQGLEVLLRTGLAPTLYYAFRIYPLRVLKQILCNFMSLNGPDFQDKNEELVRFVLNKERYGLNPKYKVFVFYCTTKWLRHSPISALISLFGGGPSSVFSEFVHPPWGYALVLDSIPPDERLVDITFFANHRYSYAREIHLRLPVLPIATTFPGDYRTKKEVEEQAEQSKKAMEEQKTARKRAHN